MGPVLDHARAGGLLCVDRDGTGCCATCGVDLSPCACCRGRGYHLDGCDESEETILGKSPLRTYLGTGPLTPHTRRHLLPAMASEPMSLDELAFLVERDVRRHQEQTT